MKLFLPFILIILSYSNSLYAQFEVQIEPDHLAEEVQMPESPLTSQILFVGTLDMVETTATYGNPAATVPAKEWHDFIGFTPDNTDESLGWITVNHERIQSDDNIGDGGGMTSFRVKRTDEYNLEVMEQTLPDGRTGKFFNVDFANTVGETGMNCGGINTYDGRIWTAEEWFRGDNASIYGGGAGVRDTSDFTINNSGIAAADGQTVKKFQNFNYMTEIDPINAVAIRKQYNWGRQPFEGGTILPDNKTVFLGVDDTPGFFTKFVADVAGDFTKGKTYVYKHDGDPKWVEIDNTDFDKMLNFKSEAVSVGATMYNRLEWVTLDPNTGLVYLTETGRDNPGSRWADELEDGAVAAPHHIARAAEQGVENIVDGDYWDYYGRVLVFDPSTDEMKVFLEAGPFMADNPVRSQYPSKQLSNPDGLYVMDNGDRGYLFICEDLNGTSFGRMPAGISNRSCELYLLDLAIENPSLDDLIRISVTPIGAEITGVNSSKDGKTLFVNSQHPYAGNPEPYNHSLTYAIHGWDKVLDSVVGLDDPDSGASIEGLEVFPNPTAREIQFNEVIDFALYDASGKRLRVYRDVQSINVQEYASGTYFIKTEDDRTAKLVIK